MNLLVCGQVGERLRKVAEVPVQVDVILVDAPQPGEAVRIDGVDEDREAACRQGIVKLIRKVAHLATRAAEALYTVGSREDEQRAISHRRPQDSHIHEQVLAFRPLEVGQRVMRHPAARGLRLRQELCSCFRV